ncbi:MAG: hypothetical protein GX610_00590 [Rhodococcus sp.]|nr:hypothetical protein [Rhodococcus sp. (in: high G+C Gram-positive bacteria)]
MADDDDSSTGLTSTPTDAQNSTDGQNDGVEKGSASSDAAAPRQRRRAVRRAGSPVGASSERPSDITVPKSADAAPEATAPKAATAKVGDVGASEKAIKAEKAEKAEKPKKGKKADKAEKGRKDSLLRGRSKKSLAAVGIAGLLVVGLIAAAVFLAVMRYQTDAYNDERQAYVDAAKQAVLNLTTIHPESAQNDVNRIIEGSTGPFQADFEARKDPFISVIQDGQVRTDGEIVSAAVEKQSDELAQILVAAKTTVSSAEQPEPSDRAFRMRVTIVDQDGSLKASNVEFVP